MSTCLASGPWDAVTQGANANLTKQQFQKSFLATLCLTLEALTGIPSMSNCATAGVWDIVTGNRMVSDQEFYSQALSTMCAIKDAVIAGGGGGGGINQVVIYDDVAALPAAPVIPTVPWLAMFRDGSNSQVWDPDTLAWF